MKIIDIPSVLPKSLPPSALKWTVASSFASAISYADRGTSAIAASSLLDELKWTESQLGDVQSSFFLGYALTQVLGGLLAGNNVKTRAAEEEMDGFLAPGPNSAVPGYRRVLPLSLFFTGLATLLFPVAAKFGGTSWACADRFCLGLLEGMILPAAMAGVSATTSRSATQGAAADESTANVKATASSLVISGCYLGSAWGYLSAWVIYSEPFQTHLVRFGYEGSVWPLVFYVNGVMSMAFLLFFRDEFNLSFSKNTSSNEFATMSVDVLRDTVGIARDTFSSESGRAILTAQIGQGALLYTIASWGPLYLERVNPTPLLAVAESSKSVTSSVAAISEVASTASAAASSLILPQIAQAAVGASIGAAADRLSAKFGARLTRRTLQLISGVGPAVALLYLTRTNANEAGAISPVLMFGLAQTLSALSLGAVSVSHLDVATPPTAGAVYGLGNVFAAASGSVMVSLFGRLLDGGGSSDEFALPFRAVAVLSAACSVVYGCTIDTRLEIGVERTSVRKCG